MQVEKTVFISYRRSTSTYQARAVYQSLSALGYDVFLDFETIDSGAFDQMILNQIKARAHFLVILAPGALVRCANPDDWLRREIETAMAYERNIVPLLFSGFSFGDSAKYLTGKLASLSRYNAIKVYADYFDEAINRLHTRYLNERLDMVLHPAPQEDQPVIAERQKQADAAPKVTEEELTAADHYNRAATHGNLDDMLADYNKAIELNPAFAQAYNGRAMVRQERGDLTNALIDFNRSLELDNPEPHVPYENRAMLYAQLKSYEAAEADLTKSLALGNPKPERVLSNRGFIRCNLDQFAAAVEDFSAVIEMEQTGYLSAYSGRAWAYYQLGEHERAIADADVLLARDVAPSLRAATRHTRGAAHLALGHCEQALDDLEAANRKLPDDPRVLALLDQARQQCSEKQA